MQEILESLSSWRAWIEMRAERILQDGFCSRSPHGERGLKYPNADGTNVIVRSLSSWRAWIEIDPTFDWLVYPAWSLSSWRAWIEISMTSNWATPTLSLSSWRAWIEIVRPV